MYFQRHEDGKYIGFYQSTDGTGAGLAGEIISYMEKYGIDHAFLEILSCDGTSANTGYKVNYFITLVVTCNL